MVDKQELVIVAAVNGGMQQSRDGAKVPITPEEIAEDARLCREAGATVVHIHARDENGRNTGDPEIFSEIIRLIRERCDILIQTTNGIGIRRDPVSGGFVWPSDDERLALLNIEPSPDLYGVAAGSTDFYHPEGGYAEETPYINSPHFLRETIQAVYAKGSTVEYEVVDPGCLHRLRRYADEGVFDADAGHVWLLHGGGLTSWPPTARALTFSVEEGQRLFPNAKWGTLGAGKAQFKLNTLGLALGCDTVRVGFEDNIYLPSGKPAERNHQLVEAMVEIAAIYGRRPATVDETREVFELGSRSTPVA